MKRIYFILLIFIVTSGSFISAQQKKDIPKDKKKIELKPNSREFKPVIRDNHGNTLIVKRNRAMLIKRRADFQRLKMMRLQKKRTIKQEQINRRRQIIQQRRALRK